MEYVEVPASQIMPVSGYEAPMGLSNIKSEANDFFFAKGQVPYKIYKNAGASSTGLNKTTAEFVENFFDVLESSLRLQLKEKNDVDKALLIKDAFDVLRSTFKLMNRSGVEFDTLTFYSTLIGFILGKMR